MYFSERVNHVPIIYFTIGTRDILYQSRINELKIFNLWFLGFLGYVTVRDWN